MVLEKTLESPLDCKEIQPVNPKGDQCWVFIGRTDVEAEAPIVWPPDTKSWLIWKDPDAGKDWGQEKKGPTEDEMVWWHHRLNGHGFGWTPGVGDGQGGLQCCSAWDHKESDMTEQLNWTELNWFMLYILKSKCSSKIFENIIICLLNYIFTFIKNDLNTFSCIYLCSLYSKPLIRCLSNQCVYPLNNIFLNAVLSFS